ncbi:MAG: DNA-cytosine methyltransferase [Hyphomicrobiales bacterium]|nr:DNA-cytosine methyltransferase [Hyphomicrobiales bacterium]
MPESSASSSLRLMGDTRPTFLEFFAGGGMARAGLGDGWRCAFANDFDAMKVATYRANWGDDDMRPGDVGQIALTDLPAGVADLAWASFPCQDLSLAGDYRGLGRERDDAATRSGTFWAFWKLMRGLAQNGRAPRMIVLENVYGAMTSRAGQDFAAIGAALAAANYRFGAVVINASNFVPQSRPRVFFIAVHRSEALPAGLTQSGPSAAWHPPALVDAQARMTGESRAAWLWWNIPQPAARNIGFADIIEDEPVGVAWHSAAQTQRLLDLMSDVHRAKLAAAQDSGVRMVGGVYRRTRIDKDGVKRQRAEVRFDDVAGCLRTPGGGSSRQSILVVEGRSIRSRLLSPREAARLMGLSDDYRLPARYNDAYHVCGDGVCAPVVGHIARHILEPLLGGRRAAPRVAAE